MTDPAEAFAAIRHQIQIAEESGQLPRPTPFEREMVMAAIDIVQSLVEDVRRIAKAQERLAYSAEFANKEAARHPM